jgi:hypothetical protein
MQKNANITRFFYQNGKLVTLKTGEQSRSIFRSSDVPLAEQHLDGTRTSGAGKQLSPLKPHRPHHKGRTSAPAFGQGCAFHKSVAFHPALRRCSWNG